MTASIALAAPGLGCESEVLSTAASCGLEIRRRCVDSADLLGACLGAPGLTAVITAGLPRISAEIVARLLAAQSRVIGIALRSDDRAVLEALAVDAIIDSTDDARELIARLSSALRHEPVSSGVWNLDDVDPQMQVPAESGRVIAVWGPAGAPGRTTTASVLAHCLSEHSRTVILDADTSAPSLALHLGLADDPSGIIVACRHAETGELSSRSLAVSLSGVSERLFALTGLAHSRRSAEIRPAALARVVDSLRREFPYVVIDVGAELDAVAAAPALAAADAVVAVCRAEPLGMARFLAELPALAETGVPMVAVITGGAQVTEAQRLIREVARDLGLSVPILDLSRDPAALSKALRRGTAIRSLRSRSRAAGSAARLVELVA